MKIHIPILYQGDFKEKELFFLTRPFYDHLGWSDNDDLKIKWGLDPFEYHYTDKFEDADVVFLPRTINYYLQHGHLTYLNQINNECVSLGIKAYGYIAGDFGEKFPEFSRLIYFRMGGFRSQLNKNNLAFPSSLSDHMFRLYATNNIAAIPWQEKPIVGFCGQANLSVVKALKETFKFSKENVIRFLKNPLRTDYEPLFASGYERAKLLKRIDASSNIESRFIYREQYRAGATTTSELDRTTKEFYDNLRDSQYVVCIRGGGNFSVRFYQTLMMGRIPVFINTDCLLPFETSISWHKNVVWVDWNERDRIVDKIIAFHQSHTPDQLLQIQKENREIWLNELSLSGMLQKIKHTL